MATWVHDDTILNTMAVKEQSSTIFGTVHICFIAEFVENIDTTLMSVCFQYEATARRQFSLA